MLCFLSDRFSLMVLLKSPNLGALDCSQNLARKDVHPKSRRPARHFHDVSAVVWDLNTAAPSPGALSERWTALDGQMCPCSRLNKNVGGASFGQSPLTSRWRRGEQHLKIRIIALGENIIDQFNLLQHTNVSAGSITPCDIESRLEEVQTLNQTRSVLERSERQERVSPNGARLAARMELHPQTNDSPRAEDPRIPIPGLQHKTWLSQRRQTEREHLLR